MITTLKSLKGILKRKNQKSVSVEEMNASIKRRFAKIWEDDEVSETTKIQSDPKIMKSLAKSKAQIKKGQLLEDNEVWSVKKTKKS